MSRARHRRREGGQAAVETALTLPLAIFMILGTIQLFALYQGRLIAQYAVSRAARAGTLRSGDCLPMTHAALAALVPAIATLRGPDRATSFGAAFGARRANRFVSALDDGRDEHIVWLRREGPASIPADVEETWDLPAPDAEELTLELRMIFWFPLRIPFANWVFSWMALTHFGIEEYQAADPLMGSKERARWEAAASLDAEIGAELQRRSNRRHYAFPVQVTYATRMMTPPRARHFAGPDCDPDDPRYAAR